MDLRSVQRKFDRVAIDQLREEVVRLDALLRESERGRAIAEDAAEYWETQCRSIEDQINDQGRAIGLCIDGSMVALGGTDQ